MVCCAIGMTGNYSHPIIYTPVRYQSCMGDWPGFWPPYLFVVSEPQGGLGEHMHPMVLIMFNPITPIDMCSRHGLTVQVAVPHAAMCAGWFSD